MGLAGDSFIAWGWERFRQTDEFVPTFAKLLDVDLPHTVDGWDIWDVITAESTGACWFAWGPEWKLLIFIIDIGEKSNVIQSAGP